MPLASAGRIRRFHVRNKECAALHCALTRVRRDQNHRALALELICSSMKLESGATMCKNQLIFITPHSIPPEVAEKPEVHVSVVMRPAQ